MRTRNGSLRVEEPLNDLIFEFQRFVEDFLPKAVMMENVPALATDPWWRRQRAITSNRRPDPGTVGQALAARPRIGALLRHLEAWP